MMSFAAVYVSLVLLFHRSSVEAKCENSDLYFVGDEVKIICGIQGTYSWPEWRKWKKGVTTLANEGSNVINPKYKARFSYDTDNKTLIITYVTQYDEGIYVCACAGHVDSPQTYEVKVQEPINARGIKNAVVAFFVLAIMVLVVVIIRQCCILIRIYKIKRTEKKIKGRKNVFHIVPSIQILILIIAVIFFMTVLVWFIVIQTEEDCEQLTKKNNYVSLLGIELIAFVLGVIILVYAYIGRKKIIQQIIDSAFPKDTTIADPHGLFGDVKEANFELINLEKKGRIITTLEG